VKTVLDSAFLQVTFSTRICDCDPMMQQIEPIMSV